MTADPDGSFFLPVVEFKNFSVALTLESSGSLLLLVDISVSSCQPPHLSEARALPFDLDMNFSIPIAALMSSSRFSICNFHINRTAQLWVCTLVVPGQDCYGFRLACVPYYTEYGLTAGFLSSQTDALAGFHVRIRGLMVACLNALEDSPC